MPDLTNRQRFALRESLCDVLSGYSEGYSDSSWEPAAVADAKNYVMRNRFGGVWCQLRGLVELLGEWPVGYRGQGGWEPIEPLPAKNVGELVVVEELFERWMRNELDPTVTPKIGTTRRGSVQDDAKRRAKR